jgi:hypothetical protein
LAELVAQLDAEGSRLAIGSEMAPRDWSWLTPEIA